MPGQVVFLNHARVGYSFRREDGRQSLGHQIILASNPIPLLTLMLKTVNVQGHRRAGQPEYGGKRRVSRITD